MTVGYIETVDYSNRNVVYYYRINTTYEIYYNPLESSDEDINRAKEILYDRLSGLIPEKYEKFSSSLSMTQLKDSLNYLLTFSAFFRSREGLPMEEYVGARELKDIAEKEIEEFFNSIDCEFRKLTVKSFS